MFKKLISISSIFTGLVFAASMHGAQAAILSVNDWNGKIDAVENVQSRNTVSRFNVNGSSVLSVDSALSGSTALTIRFIDIDGLQWDPGSQGGIDSFDYSIDQLAVRGGHGWGFGFKQDGTYHLFDMFTRFRNSPTPTNRPNFTTFSEQNLAFNDASFRTVGGGSGTLDFSLAGSLIDMGIIIFSGNGGAPFRQDLTQYDNFSLILNEASVSAVPVPAALPLLATGLLGLGLLGRRKRNK